MNEFPTSRDNQPLIFFALVFLLTIPFLLFGGSPLPIPLKLPFSALMLVNPTIAASILSYRQDGWAGVKNLFQKVLDFHKIRNSAWYAVILLLNPVIFLMSYGIMRLAGRPLPADPRIPWLLAPLFLLVFFLTAVLEELGWMGYAIDPLQRRFGTLTASIILGVVWQVWHVIPDLQNAQPVDWILWHRAGSVALRVLMVWIYNHTGKSVFGVILVHDLNNVCTYLFPNYGSHYDPLVTGALFILTAVLVTAGEWWVSRRPAPVAS